MLTMTNEREKRCMMVWGEMVAALVFAGVYNIVCGAGNLKTWRAGEIVDR